MANSPLVSYTRLSPNHSGQRTHSVDRISPHCVVGQCSVETLGSIFANSAYQASCQYGIGVDGRVGMYVDERNRSWCTSSWDNDQRAITIECASDTTHPYAMNSKVYATLIALCVDICKRYNKEKLLWFNDKNKSLQYAPKTNEMVLTVHRWFANKSCPGDWLYSRLGDVAAKVTAQLGGNNTAPAPKPPVETPDTLYRVQTGAYKVLANARKTQAKLQADGFDTLMVKVGDLYKVQCGAFANKANAEALAKQLRAKGYSTIIVSTQQQPKDSSNAKRIWDFLKSKGLNAYAIAGLMGNLEAESALNPKNLQNTYEKSLNMDDETYTARVDNGTYHNFVMDKAGYGLAQWTFWTRKDALLDFAKNNKKSIGDLDLQLNFLWDELQNYKSVMATLKTATSVRQASDAVLTGYEKPANQSEGVKQSRAKLGEAHFAKYA